MSTPRREQTPLPPQRPTGGLMYLPFELLVQIASTGLLDPLDLVRMSRASQYMHQVIMGNDYVWHCLARRVFRCPQTGSVTPPNVAAWLGCGTNPATWKELLISQELGERKFGANVLGESLHTGLKAQEGLGLAPANPQVIFEKREFRFRVDVFQEGTQTHQDYDVWGEAAIYSPETNECVWTFAPGPLEDVESFSISNFYRSCHYGKWLVTLWEGGIDGDDLDDEWTLFALVHMVAYGGQQVTCQDDVIFVRTFRLYTYHLTDCPPRACALFDRLLIFTRMRPDPLSILTLDITTGEIVRKHDPASFGLPVSNHNHFHLMSSITALVADEEFLVFCSGKDYVAVQRSTGTAVCSWSDMLTNPKKYQLDGIEQINIAISEHTQQVTFRTAQRDAEEPPNVFFGDPAFIDHASETIMVWGYFKKSQLAGSSANYPSIPSQTPSLVVLMNYKHAFTGRRVRGKACMIIIPQSIDGAFVFPTTLARPMSGRLLLPLIQNTVMCYADPYSLGLWPQVGQREGDNPSHMLPSYLWVPTTLHQKGLVPCILDWKTTSCAAEIQVIQIFARPTRVKCYNEDLWLSWTVQANELMEEKMYLGVATSFWILKRQNLSHSGASIVVGCHFSRMEGLPGPLYRVPKGEPRGKAVRAVEFEMLVHWDWSQLS